MKVIDIKTAVASMASPMSNAFVSFTSMTCSVVAVTIDVGDRRAPVVGFAFSSNGRYEVDGLLRSRFVPRLAAAGPSDLESEQSPGIDPRRVRDVLMRDEKPGGHGERAIAVGTLEAAVWDAVAKAHDMPLWALLDRLYGDGQAPDRRVAVYAAGGYYADGKSLRDLQDEIRRYLRAGYEAVKIKVGGMNLGDDLERIEAVLDVVGSGSRLAVDANARFDLNAAIRFAEAIEPYRLRWFEEPGDPSDFLLQRELGRHYPGPFATGENLFGWREVRNLARHSGLDPSQDILQFDPILGYGIAEYVDATRALAMLGWSSRQLIPHGGHQLSLHVAAALRLGGNEAYPAVFGPFGGFADGMVVDGGYVELSDAPGVGYESKADLMAVLSGLFQ